MSKHFHTHTRHSEAEREMMAIPFFDQRYKKQLCSIGDAIFCRSCSKKELLRGDTSIGAGYCHKCPYIVELLLRGKIDRWEALRHACYHPIQTPSKIFFDTRHRRMFGEFYAKHPDQHDREETAVLYLLTSDEILCDYAENFSSNPLSKTVDINENKELTQDQRMITQMVAVILQKLPMLSKSRYTDPKGVSDRTIALLYCAMLILRCGMHKNSPLRRLIR